MYVRFVRHVLLSFNFKQDILYFLLSSIKLAVFSISIKKNSFFKLNIEIVIPWPDVVSSISYSVKVAPEKEMFIPEQQSFAILGLGFENFPC